MENFIRQYNNIVPHDLCKRIIKEFKGSKEVFDGKTISGVSDHKISRDLIINPEKGHRDIDVELFTTVSSAYNKYLGDFPHIARMFEGFKIDDSGYMVQMYPKGVGQYKVHTDAVNPDRGLNRMISCVIYLNDVKEGGETEFTMHGVKFKPKRGSVLLFPSNFCYPHKGNMPISNDKYIITTFFMAH